jgi:hypothetical protein
MLFIQVKENNENFKCPKTVKKCANCGGEHTANYGGCKSYKDVLTKRIAVQNKKKAEQIQNLSLENSQKVRIIEEKQDLIVKQNKEILESIKNFQTEVAKIKQEFADYKIELAYNIIDFYTLLKYEIDINTPQRSNLAILAGMISGSSIDTKQVIERINQTKYKITNVKPPQSVTQDA